MNNTTDSAKTFPLENPSSAPPQQGSSQSANCGARGHPLLPEGYLFTIETDVGPQTRSYDFMQETLDWWAMIWESTASANWPEHTRFGLYRLAHYRDQHGRGIQSSWMPSAILELETTYGLVPERVA